MVLPWKLLKNPYDLIGRLFGKMAVVANAEAISESQSWFKTKESSFREQQNGQSDTFSPSATETNDE